MSTALKIITACLLAGLLAGCLSSGSQEFQRYYVLEDLDAQPASSKKTRASTLLVAPTTASGFYETQDIVFSRAQGARAYYQYHSWTERPARRISDLLAARLARSRSFETVAFAASGISGGLILNTHLIEIYHDAATMPGNARVALTAELTDPVQRRLVARRTFSQTTPAQTYDAPGAVRALNAAVTAMFDDVAAWVDAAAPR